MSSFGIIAEGITDQLVLWNILAGFFNDPNVDVNNLIPKDKNQPSGWTKVFSYLESPEFKESFKWNKYIIIQIDSDTCSSWKFKGISRVIPKQKESVKRHIEEITGIFISLIGHEFYTEYKDRIIFAIAVESIECWLLPFYATQKSHVEKTINCLNTLNYYIKPKHGFTIDPNRKAYNDFEYYRKIAEPLKDQKKLRSNYKKNPSLEVLYNSLISLPRS